MTEYNKLVRDRIPEIMKKNNEMPVIKILDEKEYKDNLDLKLQEEVAEYIESGEVEELADILEVIFAIAESKNYSKEKFMKVYQNKHDKRGGFKERIYLLGKE